MSTENNKSIIEELLFNLSLMDSYLERAESHKCGCTHKECINRINSNHYFYLAETKKDVIKKLLAKE